MAVRPCRARGRRRPKGDAKQLAFRVSQDLLESFARTRRGEIGHRPRGVVKTLVGE